jgi:hypothetical protein
MSNDGFSGTYDECKYIATCQFHKIHPRVFNPCGLGQGVVGADAAASPIDCLGASPAGPPPTDSSGPAAHPSTHATSWCHPRHAASATRCCRRRRHLR